MDGTLELKVSEALGDDVGKGLARLDPEDIKAINAVLGDVIEIAGEKITVARITGTLPQHTGKRLVQIDGITRENAKAFVGGKVRVKKVTRKTATTVVISPLDFTNILPDEKKSINSRESFRGCR